jgi:hypothetical protein
MGREDREEGGRGTLELLEITLPGDAERIGILYSDFV